MRLLVVDSNQLLGWQIRHQVPGDVALDVVSDLAAAVRRLRDDPPDAAVVSLPPAELPWRDFQHLCATRTPPVPVLYESCVHRCPGAAGIDADDGYAAFLAKPASREELAKALEALFEACRSEGRGTTPIS